MRESEKRMKEYQEMLPVMRTKVSTAATLLVVAIVMMVSASLAWYTLSANPEIEGVSTTIAANGNLEVALSKSDGSQPSESAVGDSNLPLLERNLTWGNLVNLSDASYGLDQIILRPASLNRSSLIDSPLFAAKYSADGRIQTLSSDFAYSNYDTENKSFLVPLTPRYGVRAISSVTYKFLGGEEKFYAIYQEASNKLNLAKSQYSALTSDSSYMSTISSLMGDYLTEKFGEDNSIDYSGYIPQLYQMMVDMDTCLETTADAVVQIANAQYMLKKGDEASKTPYNLETLFNANSDALKNNGISIGGLSTFKTNYNIYNGYLNTMESINTRVSENGAAVYWNEISAIVNFLVDIRTVEVDKTPVSKLGMSEAVSIVLGGSEHEAVIYKGMLYDMEQFLGTYMFAEDLPVKVTVSYSGITLSPTLKADVYTAAKPTAYLQDEIVKIKNSQLNLTGSTAVAADTYGLAIDFWVRSNADIDYLLLEGQTIEGQRTDEYGNAYYTDIEGNVLYKAPDGNWYYEDGTAYTYDAENPPTAINEVIGYEGENRVWEDVTLTNSTTQGNGSCYVFYADTPQEQAQSLEILDAMSVVFIDQDGTLLAEADMDVDSCYAESGRVTVPLKLRSTSLNVGTDDDGNKVYAITQLTRGEAKRITALIYINGEAVDNTEVLADGNISGKLNLQFGSYVEMEPIEDDTLSEETVTVSAEAEKTSFTYGTDDLSTLITLTVDGMTPTNVTANFTRKVNSTQGKLQEEMVFTNVKEGEYTATATFTSPGTYVLRSVWLDGIEYDLESPVTITIEGFGIDSVTWDETNNTYASIMSADSYYTERVYVDFSGSVNPTKVQAVFRNTDNQQVIANLTKGTTGTWSGTAQFASSGTYSLQYLIVDGEYYEIPSNMQKTLVLSLGIKAKVQISQTVFEEFTGNPAKSVNVYATIMDNKGNPLTELSGVTIQYVAQGSGLIDSGLYSTLTWNATEKRYVGAFEVKNAGAFEFGYLTIGSNYGISYLYSAEAPVLTAIPLDPPSYYGNLTDEQIFAYGTDVSMRITMADSAAIADAGTSTESYMRATIQQLDENGNVQTITIDGEEVPIAVEVDGRKASHTNEEDESGITNLTDWVFTMPTTDDLTAKFGQDVSQIGTWQMTQLAIVGAYDSDGVKSTVDNPMIIDVSNKGIRTMIDAEMTVIVSGEGQELSSDKLFMESNTVTEGLDVTICGDGGAAINNDLISEVKVTYVLDVDNLDYSTSSTTEGYSYDGTEAQLVALKANLKAKGTVTVDLMKDPDSTSYMINPDKSMDLPLAGSYKLDRVKFTIGNTTYVTKVESNEVGSVVVVPITGEAPIYRFEWDAPEVTITAVSPDTNTYVKVNATDKDYSIFSYLSTVDNKYKNSISITEDKISCTVYFSTTLNNKTLIVVRVGVVSKYEPSTVTTQISNVNRFNSATLVVGGEDVDVSFEYNMNSLEDTKAAGGSKVGGYEALVEYGLSTYTREFVNGSATHITIKSEDQVVTYVFDLDKDIEINTPY